ncbi:MAG: DMT family transporter [Candidatus Wallbacteria bacterium]
MTEERRSFWTGIAEVVTGVLFFAPGAVFIKMAAGVTPLEITLHRMAIAAIFILIYSKITKTDFMIKTRGELFQFMCFGLITAIHFGCFVTSLSYTKVSHSLALCYTAPIFSAITAAVFLKETLNYIKICGIIVAVIGVTILVGFEPGVNSKILFGDFLALMSGMALGFYHTIGRFYKDRYNLFKYTGNMYIFAALYLFAGLIAARYSMPAQFSSVYSFNAAAGILCSVLFCTFLGHLLVNSALRKVKTVIVSLITTQEITGGILFAWLFFSEPVSLNSITGIIVSLAGIFTVIISK